LRLSDRFNGAVALDLKEHVHNKSWILHIIDLFTRYSAACLIKTKRAEEIIKKVCSVWITNFGAPAMFLTDNGGEFSNESFRELNEKFNVETATTAAESPFSNGTCERHHLILVEAMQKTMLEEKCDPEIALAYAVAAKNTLSNRGGLVPTN
jgi:transposase InsO family protein